MLYIQVHTKQNKGFGNGNGAGELEKRAWQKDWERGLKIGDGSQGTWNRAKEREQRTVKRPRKVKLEKGKITAMSQGNMEQKLGKGTENRKGTEEYGTENGKETREHETETRKREQKTAKLPG